MLLVALRPIPMAAPPSGTFVPCIIFIAHALYPAALGIRNGSALNFQRAGHVAADAESVVPIALGGQGEHIVDVDGANRILGVANTAAVFPAVIFSVGPAIS